jgi:hypothetical protein
MKLAEHEEHSRQILGEPWTQVHEYLDQHQPSVGPKHRDILHNLNGIGTCIDRWGYQAGAAACLHIWADQIGLYRADDGTFKLATIIGEAS